MLLNQFHLTTGTPVSFELRDVKLSDAAIFEMPFLYLTGTTDFILTGAERANLRRFLMNGGVLFAEAAEGRRSFDLIVPAGNGTGFARPRIAGDPEKPCII